MSSLWRIWKCSYISLRTKVHLYCTLIMSVILYSAETWTLLVWKMKSLHGKCLRQLLCVNWRDHVNSASVLQQTDWSHDNHQLSPSSSLFGHVARLDAGVPAHTALRLMIDVHSIKAGNDVVVGLVVPGSIIFVKTQTSRHRLCGHWRQPKVTKWHKGQQPCDDDDDASTKFGSWHRSNRVKQRQLLFYSIIKFTEYVAD